MDTTNLMTGGSSSQQWNALDDNLQTFAHYLSLRSIDEENSWSAKKRRMALAATKRDLANQVRQFKKRYNAVELLN